MCSSCFANILVNCPPFQLRVDLFVCDTVLACICSPHLRMHPTFLNYARFFFIRNLALGLALSTFSAKNSLIVP